MSEVHVRGVVAMVIVVVCGEVMASLSLLLECSLRKLLIDIHDQPLFPEKVYQVSHLGWAISRCEDSIYITL